MGAGIMVDFSEDGVWEEWGRWVLHRCEASSNERLLRILHKVCRGRGRRPDGHWADTCGKLLQLVGRRMQSCADHDVYQKLKKFKDILEP